MPGIVGNLVSRGLQACSQNYHAVKAEAHTFQLPAWGIGMLWATAIAFVALMSAIRYTYGEVVATLTMIESSTETTYVKAEPHSDDPDAPLTETDKTNEKTSLVEPEVLLVKPALITSNIRTTMKHLRTRGGFLSCFRGLSLWLVYHFVAHQTHHLLMRFTGHGLISSSLTAVATVVLLGRLNMTWTHIVVSEPSTKWWGLRIPDRKSWVKIAPATAVFALAEQLTVALPHGLYNAWNLKEYNHNPSHFGEISEAERKMVVMQYFAVAALALALAVLLVIPASVTLTRVQASMLPEEDESIVPFDRSFGGKVTPEVVGGSGKLGILEAWKSFDWAARIRLMKLYGKIAAIQVIVTMMFVAIVGAELKMIMGDNLMVGIGGVETNGGWEIVAVPDGQ
ncbi:MAG: hypothetical protein M1835_005927 [Candelina submexicana]|nr:MAG: hypothetical protein M1835_005927 [Candelina submexicana]